jgi:hypothetical protein
LQHQQILIFTYPRSVGNVSSNSSFETTTPPAVT